MSKLPYEQVAIEVDKLMMKIAKASSLEVDRALWETYRAFLEAAGWDSISFDQEMIKRIDSSWEETNQTIWN